MQGYCSKSHYRIQDQKLLQWFGRSYELLSRQLDPSLEMLPGPQQVLRLDVFKERRTGLEGQANAKALEDKISNDLAQRDIWGKGSL